MCAYRNKGDKVSLVHHGSEDYFEYSCDPCNTAGDQVEAQGFCNNCEDYLCETCYKSHSRNKASRNHTLLDKDKMPKKYKLCDPCKLAGDEEEAVGYCVDCTEHLCSSCFKSHSRNKASRQHVLTVKDNIADVTKSTFMSSVAKMKIFKGDADSQKSKEEYTYLRDINAKSDVDKKDCYIVDMTQVTRTELLLADCENESLKVVDLDKNVIIDSFRLKASPNALAMVSHDQVAVVLGNTCKIKIVSITGGLSVKRTLNTNGNCVNIKYNNGMLYVSYKEPVKFQILKLTGAVYKTINPDNEVLNYCALPRYVAVSPDDNMIYISDWTTNKVICTGTHGNMISMYKGELDMPCDISVSPFGTVYLCNRKQHVVYKMTSDLSVATVILGRGNGLFGPQAMCFNTDKKHFYISSTGAETKYRNFIKVYRWI